MEQSSNDSQQDITIVTGQPLGAHPFYRERQALDRLSGHDWLMMIALGLASAMGARFLTLAIQLFNFSSWLVVFSAVVFLPMVALSVRMPHRMPRLLSVITFCCAIGFIIGFLL